MTAQCAVSICVYPVIEQIKLVRVESHIASCLSEHISHMNILYISRSILANCFAPQISSLSECDTPLPALFVFGKIFLYMSVFP